MLTTNEIIVEQGCCGVEWVCISGNFDSGVEIRVQTKLKYAQPICSATEDELFIMMHPSEDDLPELFEKTHREYQSKDGDVIKIKIKDADKMHWMCESGRYTSYFIGVKRFKDEELKTLYEHKFNV